MFVRELVGFADRLATRDIRIHKLACQPYWFWELLLQPGAEVDQHETVGQTGFTRVFWDGKEYNLSIESSLVLPEPFPDVGTVGGSPRAPTPEQVKKWLAKNPWKHELRTRIGRTGDAIGVAEDLLIRRFSGSAGTNPGRA